MMLTMCEPVRVVHSQGSHCGRRLGVNNKTTSAANIGLTNRPQRRRMLGFNIYAEEPIMLLAYSLENLAHLLRRAGFRISSRLPALSIEFLDVRP